METRINIKKCGRYTTTDSWESSEKDFLSLDRLFYVNSGWAKMYNDGKEYTLLPGNLYLISKFQSLKMGSSQNFNHTYFDFKGTYAFRADTFMEINTEDNPLCSLMDFIHSIIPDDTVLFGDEEYKLTVEKTLDTLVEYIVAKFNVPLVENDFIVKALDIISRDCMNISVNKLASTLNLNESHLIRLFKKHTGITPKQHIQSYRLSKALEMLKKGVNVADASEKCGYSSSSAFYFAFKEKFGYSPSDITKKKK